MKRKTFFISEIIGRAVSSARSAFWQQVVPAKTFDETRTDYEFYDKLRWGRQRNYDLSSLLVQASLDIMSSWVLGQGVSASLAEKPGDVSDEDDPVNRTNRTLNRFLTRNQAVLADVYEDHLALGDMWVIVNEDGSLSVPAPDSVYVEFDPFDYRRVERVIIVTKTDEFVVRDEYSAAERVIKVKNVGDRVDPRVVVSMDAVGEDGWDVTTFPNVIGRIPIVHFANMRRTNEVFGRSMFERLLMLLGRYDDILMKALDGAEMMGNPVPVFEGLSDPQATKDANLAEETEEWTDVDGNKIERELLNWDINAALFIGDGQFNFKTPPVGYTGDVRNLLKVLFLLWLDTTHIPEFVWGGAIQGSRASVEAQMPQWALFIDAMRRRFAGATIDDELNLAAEYGVLAVIDIWLRFRRLQDASTVVGAVEMDWPATTEEDRASMLVWVNWLHERGLITDRTAMTLSGVVDNVVEEYDEATDEVLAAEGIEDEQ